MKNKLFHWLADNKVLLEVLLVSLSAATYFLMKHQVIKDQGLFMFFMTTLATFYFLSAYLPMELKGLLEIIAMKVVGIASAVSIIGLQFSSIGSYRQQPDDGYWRHQYGLCRCDTAYFLDSIAECYSCATTAPDSHTVANRFVRFFRTDIM